MVDIGLDGEQFEVAPFVLVVDCSELMKTVMSTVNSFVPELIATMRDIPEALESVALGVVTFNDKAQIVRRLTWIDEEFTLPLFVSRGRTSYVQPLTVAYELIENETRELGERGRPPVLFFITDARPNVESEADWLQARSRLLASRLRPKLVTFGYGNVDEQTLKRLASDPRLAEFSDKEPRAAMDEILKVVTYTVITLTAGDGKARYDGLANRIMEWEAGQDAETVPYKP